MIPIYLFKPEELVAFEDLLIFAKTTVQGFYAGKHRSPWFGESAEFMDYKEYYPGADASKIDWKIYQKTGRLYFKLFAEETDMPVYIMVDKSNSMVYSRDKERSKFTLTIQIAAALTHLLIQQGDKISLTMFDSKISQHIPAAGTKKHSIKLIRELSKTKPSQKTNINRAIGECLPLFKKRGKIVIISDFMGLDQLLFESLSKLLYKKHEVLLIQVLTDDELNLPRTGMANFIDLETSETIQVNVEEIREHYLNEIKKFTENIMGDAANHRIDFHLVNPKNPYVDALASFLAFQTKNNMRKV
jgi:uncharacterized protein (DUF58 family)